MRNVAQFLKLLADETRLRIIWLLLNHRELCVCDLMAALGITQSKASRHLATLRHAGLVTDRKEAAWSYYSIRPTHDEVQRAILDALRVKLAGHPDAARVLEGLRACMRRRRRGGACRPGRACGLSPAKRSGS